MLVGCFMATLCTCTCLNPYAPYVVRKLVIFDDGAL